MRYGALKRLVSVAIVLLTLGAFLACARNFDAVRRYVRESVSPAPEIHAFYNVYWSRAAPRIAEEQLSLLSKSNLRINQLHVYGIGKNLTRLPMIEQWADFPVQYDRLMPEGNEYITLKGVQDFCRLKVATGRKAIVLYLHPKGSFHPHRSNELYRKAMNHFVLRDPFPCLQALQSGLCDVCGMRFSREPHAHFPGNIWWADCAYIAQLYAPDVPRTELAGVNLPDYCIGVGRFASEHWIASHPQLRPCDCLPFSREHFYWYGAEHIENTVSFFDEDVQCVPAPRPGMQEFARNQSQYNRVVAKCSRLSAEADRKAYASQIGS